MQEFFDGLLSTEAAYSYFNWESLVFLAEAIIILWLGKIVNDMLSSYSVNEQLTKVDNKALAVSYTGYMIGQGIIVLGLLSGPGGDFVQGLISVAIWSVVGIVLLNLAGYINDRLILRGFSTTKEIIEDKNAGVGAVQAGAYIGTAWLIMSIVSADGGGNWAVSAAGVALFFVVGQIAFIIFGLIYAKVSGYDVHAEMERDNVAAGVSFGLSLVAIGIILSKTVAYTESLPAFGVWFLTGMALIFIARFLLDKLLLPGHHLKEEIAKDQNWGVALVEGGGAVLIALLLNAAFAG